MIDMSMAQRLPTDPHDAHDEFASIEAAVAGTARGRWFLDEYVRRAQNRDNERIIATLTRIERMLTADAQTRQTQMPQPEMRQPEIRQRQPERSGGANFTPSISAPPAPSSAALASSPAHVPALAPAEQGAALPVLSALRAGGALDAPHRLARLSVLVEQALSGRLRLRDEIRKLKREPARLRAVTVPPRVVIDNHASNTHTVIEVNGRDRPGLLHDVTAAMSDQGMQIASAHITTYGVRAIDVFYVKDVFGLKVENERKLASLRAALDAALVPPDSEAKAAMR